MKNQIQDKRSIALNVKNNDILKVIVLFLQQKNKFNNKDEKPIRSYIIWEDNNVSTNS